MKILLIFLIFCLTTNIIAQESLNLVEVGSHNTGSVDYNDVWGYSHNDKEILVYGARDKIAIIDVTDTTNHKIKFEYYNTGGSFAGSTDQNKTYATFTRLGDT